MAPVKKIKVYFSVSPYIYNDMFRYFETEEEIKEYNFSKIYEDPIMNDEELERFKYVYINDSFEDDFVEKNKGKSLKEIVEEYNLSIDEEFEDEDSYYELSRRVEKGEVLYKMWFD